MMLKNIFATLIVLSSLALTGCTMANRPKVEKYPDLTKTEEIIIKGKSDIRDVREIFGAPTVKGRTLNEDHLVLGYAIMSYKEFGDSSLKSRLLNALTLKEADAGAPHSHKRTSILNLIKTIKLKTLNTVDMLGPCLGILLISLIFRFYQMKNSKVLSLLLLTN